MMRIMPRTAWSLGLGLQPWEIKFLIYLHNLNLWGYLINVWINGNVYFSGLFSNGHKWVWASLIKARHWKIKFIRWAFLPCLSTVFPPIVSGNYSPFFEIGTQSSQYIKVRKLNEEICRLWAEIEAHKWRDEELSQDSQLIQANSKKKLRDNKKLLECSFAQI